VRYVLIVLGLITTALAAVLALQGLWWAAIPAGLFGVGIPWVAWVSLRDEKRAQLGALNPEATPAPDGGSLEMPRAERASPAANRSPPSSDQRERPSEKWRATPPQQPSEAAPAPAAEPTPASPPPVPPPVYPRPAPRPAHAHSRARRKKHR